MSAKPTVADTIAAPFQIVGRQFGESCVQPVSVGVPLPQGLAHGEETWAVTRGELIAPAQTRILARWPDGSVQWLLATFLHEPALSRPGDAAPPWKLTRMADRPALANPIEVEDDGDEIVVRTGAGRFLVAPGDRILADASHYGRAWLGPSGCRLVCRDARQRQHAARIESLTVEEAGPLRANLAIAGTLGAATGLRFRGVLSFFAGSALARIELTVENPRRARHRGGYWDLGDPGSVFLEDLSLEIATAAGPRRRIHWLKHPGEPFHTTTGASFEIYQDSSGGENWNSRNHRNRHGHVPLQFRGYRARTDEEEETRGLRASPVVALGWAQGRISCALEEFWQQFPSAIEVEADRLTARLWPGQFADQHELQGGEHNTRVLWIEFGHEESNPCHRLAWVHDPSMAVVDAAWVAASGAVPYLPDPAAPPRPELNSLLRDALEGERNLFVKREFIDEYGWRNYGDLWADHEEVFSDDPPPVISHYNNQYDVLHGLLVQFLHTGDDRWWKLADPLARHVIDIDIYHTTRDKPAYNGGLFWHTSHYHDAGLATHRSMSRTMRGKAIPAPGGGPGNEHNYASGLLLYHFLTGNDGARTSALGLAEWVLAMDDGRQHVLGVLSSRPTGDASRTAEAEYHGPGRGAGNSIQVLVDAWLATRDARYLNKAQALIHRTIHPLDDPADRNLDNAELRWSYTVHLQALVRFLDGTESFAALSRKEDLRATRRHARASLLRYGRWMADHERFYLDRTEELEYPTETWAAQELRKGTTLQLIARFAEGAERERFHARGQAMLDRAWESLMTFDTRLATRPVALVLQQGYLETWLASGASQPVAEDSEASLDAAFRPPERFVGQKQAVRRLGRSPAEMVNAVGSMVRPARWLRAARQTWMAERLHQWLDLWR